ncbi:MAG: SpoVR family protein [Leptolyngbya sp. PLA3]|nr:MAG: SpoVR family protein [Cyanobacteria bacterium CYA]MCE7967474.1 SpoVR family protein [Leptolyngbya sp. PL-A3]
MNTDLTPELLAHMQAIKAKAIEYGLDFFEVVYEVLDFDTMNQIAAYGGFPIRFPHWKWGMEYEKLKKRDAYGMGRIYEMVINNDPCYAYLQESNSVTDQKLVMAHVYGHSDFFKCNYWFSKTNRKMMDEMANHATRVRRHIERQGAETVERFIDACLSLEHLIDPHSVFVRREGGAVEDDEFQPQRLPAKDYMDPFINPAQEMTRQRAAHDEKKKRERGQFPRQPTRDVLLFLLRHASLEDWQADILGIVRDEAYYYAPQGQTKVMNEGWATYWHSKLMTEHFLDASEIVDYAEQHSGVVYMPPGGFNPYKIGVELFKDIERRWDRGQHGPAWESLDSLGAKERYDDRSMKGREKIFEVRRIYNDVNFIDEFLTPEFVERYQMYQFRRDPATGEVRIVSRDFDRIKQTLLYQLTNMGQPFMYVVDGNYLNRGELYLAHKFSGLEVDAAKAVEVLRNLCIIWGRPVHLQARINEEMSLLTMDSPDDDKPRRQKISDELPKPAHIVV